MVKGDFIMALVSASEPHGLCCLRGRCTENIRVERKHTPHSIIYHKIRTDNLQNALYFSYSVKKRKNASNEQNVRSYYIYKAIK